ncbi:MAG: methyltransferase [Clostridiales bacterium]|nr:methyltransferase [Clostridiales bacterium]
MEAFTLKVIQIIKNIPSGKVMTYGQIAAYAGSAKAARQVVRVLHSMSEKYKLPWHRVVNSKGHIAIKDYEGHAFQRMLLASEGVNFIEDDYIDLKKYLFYPDLFLES